MISVIIPALNEENTIRSVIQLAKRNELVSEIIVVDDQSKDQTVTESRKEGVRIITSTQLGKGHSMREGMMVAKNELLVFLDADIPNYQEDIIHLLTEPLINNEADFVKSYFERQAGRVTELLVKPLFDIFFPQLNHFRQPLSGMIAGKKSFFQKVEFENDYGVDVGLLIDMHQVKARIIEVNIGEVENDMQPLKALGRMARQVANAIFKRVGMLSNLMPDGGETMAKNFNTQLDNALSVLQPQPKKIVVFDMDNTLLRGSFINTAAKKFGFSKALDKIVSEGNNDFVRTKKISRLLEGRHFAELIEVVESIPLIGDAVLVIRELQAKGYQCGIISDSYHSITNHVKNMLGLDFSLGNELEFKQSVATGEVKIPSQFIKESQSGCEHDYCKSNMFRYILDEFQVKPQQAVAVGDGLNDLCMIRMAGTGIAFNSPHDQLDHAARYVLKSDSLMPVLGIVD